MGQHDEPAALYIYNIYNESEQKKAHTPIIRMKYIHVPIHTIYHKLVPIRSPAYIQLLTIQAPPVFYV